MTDTTSVTSTTTASSSSPPLALPIINAPTIINDDAIIEGFESLDKWKKCITTDVVDQDKIPKRLVYKHNRARAAGSGFPTVLELGHKVGLTDHEVASLFGWTTGDYRFVNPIARGATTTVEFSDYPLLPHKMTKATFSMTREEVLPYVYILSAALSKLPPEEGKQRLWRGHKQPFAASTKKIGDTLLLKGFTSVTRDRENALEFCIKDDEDSPNQRTLLVIVESKSGRCISKFSARKGEMEVLFPLDVMFQVVEPPDDSLEDDRKAVRQATERLQKKVPGAEIDLVYVKEVETTKWA